MEQLQIKALESKDIYTIMVSKDDENNMPCPKCSSDRKNINKNKKCFSFNVNKGVGHCQNCGEDFVKFKRDFNDVKQYDKPSKKNFTQLKDEHLQYFSKRGISQQTVIDFKIVSENQLIVFPYFKNNELINVKKRSIDKTQFFQGKDCEQIMFNYDNCINDNYIIIVEGEFDAMAYWQAGYKSVTSVSQGAPNPNDKNTDRKLECITNCYELFDNKEKIYIHTDDDSNGLILKKELIRRFGYEKCYIVDSVDGCKDANDILIKHGKDKLKECVDNANDIKPDGIISIHDVCNDIIIDFRNGLNKGTTTYFSEFDKYFTWRKGEVSIWTGYNNEGKSTFLRQLKLIKSIKEGTKWALFAPEDYPSKDFYSDLIHSYLGKTMDKKYLNCSIEEEIIEAMDSIRDYFYLIDPIKDKTIDSIFELMTFLIRRQGVDGITIDPYNQIEHIIKYGEREDLYIGRFMSRLKKFAVDNDVYVNLVAHQTTPEFGRGDKTYPKPNLYKIKGGGTFSDKADNVITVWRPNRFIDRDDPTVLVESQKIKKQKLVGVPGECKFEYERFTNRYYIEGYNPLSIISTNDEF